MWKTGHSLIKSKMKETGAPLAGEMSGHIFFKHRWYGFDDALYAAVRLIEAVSASGKSLTEIMDAMPKTRRDARTALPGRRAAQVRDRRRSPRPALRRRRQGRRHRRRPRQHPRRLVAAPRLEHAGRARRPRRGEGRSGRRAPGRADRRPTGEIRREARRGGALTALVTAPRGCCMTGSMLDQAAREMMSTSGFSCMFERRRDSWRCSKARLTVSPSPTGVRGPRRQRDLVGKALANAHARIAGQGFVEILDAVGRRASRSSAAPCRSGSRAPTGRPSNCSSTWCSSRCRRRRTAAGIFVQGHNVTEDKRSETHPRRAQQGARAGDRRQPARKTLSELIGSSSHFAHRRARLDPAARPDGKHLRHGAAPSLPRLCAAIDGAEIGPAPAHAAPPPIAATGVRVGHRDRPVVGGVQGRRPAARASRLLVDADPDAGARCSAPSPCTTEPREPTVRDLALVDLVTQTAALVIDRERAQAALASAA